MIRELVNEQDERGFKPWQMPVNQFNGLQIDLPQLAQLLTFTTAKDYDDWIARLHEMPPPSTRSPTTCAGGEAHATLPGT